MQHMVKSIPALGWNIIVGTLFARMATSMSMPFLAIYLTAAKGVSPALAGAVIGVSALVGVFSSFIGGSLSDRYGRKRVMLVSIAVWIVVFIGFAFAEHIAAFFVLNALNGVCRAFFEPSSRALLSDLTKPENRLMIFNLRYGAINAGVAVGPWIGLQLGSAKSTTPFLAAAIVYTLYAAALLLQFRSYEENRQTTTKERVMMRDSIGVLRKDLLFLAALIGLILSTAGYSQFSSSLSQYFANSTKFQGGVELFSHALVLNAVTVLLVQYPLTRIGKRYSALVSVMIGTLVTSIGLLGYGFAASAWMVYAVTVLFTMGEVLMFSMTDLFVDQIAPKHLKGTYFGAMGFSGFGGVIGPWLGGALLDHFGYEHGEIIFALLAGVCALGFPILLLVKLRLDRNRSAQAGSEKLHA
ncbi:MDR family MFS transporter [Ectobacillus ponti]|uniref:MFS transporter n=1 Tax=Ectobacillus ponti TaxID=2961894 RepID=A0AA41X5G9_9BACI|nr:MFS transporter [Ectobacillus ponti]MCP8969122.1 MFS transporter [Ectobacillus ponti]